MEDVGGRAALAIGLEMIGALVVGGVLVFLAGGVAGFTLSRDRTQDVLAEQTLLIAELQEGQRAMIEAAGKPVVIDAEVRAALASVPPACVKGLGGDPMTAQCLLQTCWAFGQSSAQRPDCDAAEAAAVAVLNQNGKSSKDTSE